MIRSDSSAVEDLSTLRQLVSQVKARPGLAGSAHGKKADVYRAALDSVLNKYGHWQSFARELKKAGINADDPGMLEREMEGTDAFPVQPQRDADNNPANKQLVPPPSVVESAPWEIPVEEIVIAGLRPEFAPAAVNTPAPVAVPRQMPEIEISAQRQPTQMAQVQTPAAIPVAAPIPEIMVTGQRQPTQMAQVSTPAAMQVPGQMPEIEVTAQRNPIQMAQVQTPTAIGAAPMPEIEISAQRTAPAMAQVQTPDRIAGLAPWAREYGAEAETAAADLPPWKQSYK